MVWSLSKDDDDGLDSVTPSNFAPLLGQQGSGASAGRIGAHPASEPPPASTSRPLSTAPSVVVDPSTQVPELKKVSDRSRRSLQATMVLDVRHVDKLRKEVERSRSSYKRKKGRILLLWGVAGASALLMGALVTSQFMPDDVEGAVGAQTPLSNVDLAAQQEKQERAVPSRALSQLKDLKKKGSSSLRPTWKPKPTQALQLNDLPAEGDEPQSERTLEPTKALTLEELPTE